MHFLQKVAQKILDRPSHELKDLVVILPNVRAKLFLTNFLKEMADKAIFLPVMHSSLEFMEKLSDLKSGDDFLLMSKLFNAYPLEKGEELNFDLFMNWGNSVLQDFKEIDHQLVDASALFADLSDIKQVEFWNPSGQPLSEFQKKYLSFCENLNELYTAFCASMKEDHIGHVGFLERIAFEKIKDYKAGPKTSFIIAGFNALTVAEEEIFNYIKTNHKTEFYWDFDKYYLENEVHEAGHFGRINKKKFGPSLNFISDDYTEINKDLNIIKCATGIDQSFAISELLNNASDQADFRNTAIVLSDENMLIPVLQSLPKKIKAVNVTMGYSLYNSPYYSFFEALIKLYINFRKDSAEKSYGFYHKDVERLLQSQLINEIADKEKSGLIRTFRDEIQVNKLIYIQEESLTELIKVLLDKDVEFKYSKNTSSVILSLFRSFIFKLDEKLLKNESGLNIKINREFLLHHMEVVEQVEKMMAQLLDEQDVLTLHKIWKHYSKLSKVQFTGEPLQGLQIMGLLESRNLDFDHVIMLNVNEGKLPSEKRYGSLLPNDVKRKYGVHLHREKDAIFAYHFYRLLQRAKKVDLLYSNQVDELGSGEKSRFLVQLEKELLDYHSGHEIKQTTAGIFKNISNSDKHTIDKTEIVIDRIREKIQNGLSPTSISTYLNCPLDFYFKYVVGLRESKSMVEKLESDIMGSAIHNCLDDMYQKLLSDKSEIQVFQSDIKKMQESFENILIEKFEEFIKKPYLFKGKNLLSLQMAKEMLKRYLQLESKRVSQHEVILKGHEMTIEESIDLPIGDDTIKLLLKGQVDRLETIDGMLHVVDYKTGNVDKYDTKIKSVEDMLENKNKALQLLIYALTIVKKENYDGELMASLYPMKSFSLNYLPFEMERNKIIDRALLNDLEKLLSEILSEMLNPSLPFEHKDGAKYCKYC